MNKQGREPKWALARTRPLSRRGDNEAVVQVGFEAHPAEHQHPAPFEPIPAAADLATDLAVHRLGPWTREFEGGVAEARGDPSDPSAAAAAAVSRLESERLDRPLSGAWEGGEKGQSNIIIINMKGGVGVVYLKGEARWS